MHFNVFFTPELTIAVLVLKYRGINLSGVQL